MEGKSSKPPAEMTSPAHDALPASSASKNQAAASTVSGGGGDGKRSSGSGAGGEGLPGWKLDCLCRESGMTSAVLSGGFPCF
uniref:Uncharacterized protein n=1 Tax=Oryza brachyantha TaxID=4533 RepID=J3M4Z9_ORYBR